MPEYVTKDTDNIPECPEDATVMTSVRRQVQLLEDTFDIAPVGLTFCFDRLQFLNSNFQTDQFILQHYSQGIELERLRNDLLQYSNILKSSLIELINHDYADFVSLSTNLVDLDKVIDAIAKPLRQLQSTIQSTTTDLEDTNCDITKKLKALQHLQAKRDLVHGLYTMDSCVHRLERWLSTNSVVCNQSDDNNSNSDTKLDKLDEWPSELYADSSLHEDIGQCMDRVANEYIKLQFYTKKYKDHPILLSLKPRIHEITLKLQKQLETRLKECLNACSLVDIPSKPVISKRSSEQLRHVLSIYLAIDKLPDLLLLYRCYVLRPRLKKIIIPHPELTHASSSAVKSAEILQSMYDQALDVLDMQLNLINSHVLQHTTAESSDLLLSEFDCLVGAFWPETVDLVLDNLPDIFAPGNPDRFYLLYNTSQKFVNSVQSRITFAKQLAAFRNHPAYLTFANKWSLPVYFQIRLQEVASTVENTIELGLVTNSNDGDSCLLKITETMINVIKNCWSEGVYLDKLKHRFWKLTLQMLSRYASFLQSEIKKFSTEKESSLTNIGNVSKLPSSTFKHTADTEFPLLVIYLLVDCFQLTDYVYSDLKNAIFKLISATTKTTNENLSLECQTQLGDCLNESCALILTSVEPIKQTIINCIQTSCMNSIHKVLDVPRQYRRTNREFPNSPSIYISSLTKPLITLAETGSTLANSVPSAELSLASVVKQSIIKTTQAFSVRLCEVLTSVRKMEDSLRRLHEARRGYQSSSQSLTKNSLNSDDDEKIYRQLHLDAHKYFEQVSTLWGVDAECLGELGRCVELTDSPRNKSGSAAGGSEVSTT